MSDGLALLPALALGFVGGLALAGAHFAALAANVRLYLAHGPAWRPVALHAARTAGTVGVFWLATLLGAPTLLACLAGFTAGRCAALRRWA